MIRAAGYEPEIIEYLKSGWSQPVLTGLLAKMKATPREVLREKEALVNELRLSEVDDAGVLEAMIAHPILVNRPIVATPLGIKLCRPSEVVLTLLERQPESFTKEDGEVVKPLHKR